MGYSTSFTGELKFSRPLTGPELAYLKNHVLGQDVRDNILAWSDMRYRIPDVVDFDCLTWIDLELTDNFDGLRWDGSEKTYQLVEKVNLVIAIMTVEFGDFRLTGKLLAQGEDIEDRWELIMKDQWAYRRDLPNDVGPTKCPHCGHDLT